MIDPVHSRIQNWCIIKRFFENLVKENFDAPSCPSQENEGLARFMSFQKYEVNDMSYGNFEKKYIWKTNTYMMI